MTILLELAIEQKLVVVNARYHGHHNVFRILDHEVELDEREKEQHEYDPARLSIHDVPDDETQNRCNKCSKLKKYQCALW